MLCSVALTCGEIPEVAEHKDPRHLVRLRTHKGAGERPASPRLDRGDESALAMCHRDHDRENVYQRASKNESSGWFGDH